MKYKALLLVAAIACSSLLFGQSKPSVDLKLNEAEKKVDVLVDGKLFTSYIYPSNIMKPVLWPVMSPAGNMLTRSYGMVNKAGDRSDHPHHIGVWLNYGDVNGLDLDRCYFDLVAGAGRQNQQQRQREDRVEIQRKRRDEQRYRVGDAEQR